MAQGKSKTGMKLLVFSLVCAAVAGFGIHARAKQAHELKVAVAEALPTVSTIKPKVGKGNDAIILPGRLAAWHEVALYARTNGYVAKWTADIGTHVKEGDVLAELDTPEVDAQLRQSEADLAAAIANSALAQSTAARVKELLKSDFAAKQQVDEKTSDAAAKVAAVASARANHERLLQLESFKRITAPFAGVVTARNIDTGALVNAGAGAQELFHLVEKDKLRVFVEVPQNYTQRLQMGMNAELHFAEYPDRVFPATLTTNASALDPVTRTLRVEFMVNNEKEELLPGGYTEVHIKVDAQSDSMRLPVNTLLYRADGVKVATVNGQGQVHLVPVKIGRDFGTEVEITNGLGADVPVIVNPADSIVEGQAVRVTNS